MKERKQTFGKKELILILAIAALALMFALVEHVRNSAPAAYVEISVVNTDSKRIVLDTFPLNEDREHNIRTTAGISGEVEGFNYLIIRDGNAWISEADCPNHDCVKKGKISQNGEMLVCIPHRLTVTIIGDY